jgi:predicted membrane protein
LRISQLKTFKDVRVRFRENWRGYLHQYRVLLILMFLASLADMASTIHFMLIHGPEVEGHPVVRVISLVFGPILGPMLSKATQFMVAVVVTVFLRRWAVHIFVPLIILYGWAAWFNLWGHEIYYPRLLQILERLGI